MAEFQQDDIEEAIYEMVADEVARGEFKPGLQAKAIAHTMGDEQKARAFYILLRARQIAGDLASQADHAAHQEHQAKRAEQAAYEERQRRYAREAEERKREQQKRAKEQAKAARGSSDVHPTVAQSKFDNYLAIIIVSIIIMAVLGWLSNLV